MSVSVKRCFALFVKNNKVFDLEFVAIFFIVLPMLFSASAMAFIFFRRFSDPSGQLCALRTICAKSDVICPSFSVLTTKERSLCSESMPFY